MSNLISLGKFLSLVDPNLKFHTKLQKFDIIVGLPYKLIFSRKKKREDNVNWSKRINKLKRWKEKN